MVGGAIPPVQRPAVAFRPFPGTPVAAFGATLYDPGHVHPCMTEFTTDVELTDIAVRDTAVSAAVDEPARAMILDILADGEHTVSEVHAELERRGYDRTRNTIRHHVNELRDAGLVDVARLEERRGGTTKFYRANTIVLSYTIPEESRDTITAIADDVAPDVAAIVDRIEAEHGDDLDDVVAQMAPCEHCADQKYETYLYLTILRRAFVRAHVRDR